ncbi:hypothetical protein Q3G72_002707 [Acer saccharum]|nr:hypothetical protein Q3G72_002707 [Acer saccharum]
MSPDSLSLVGSGSLVAWLILKIDWLSRFTIPIWILGSCVLLCRRISAFDLKNHVWSEVQTLRPPGVIFSFLIACQDMLILAGMCNTPRGPSFNLWKIDEKSMEFSEIAIMPHNFLYSLVDSDEDDKFASLKCVGLGNLIYVFNEEYHKKYPACLCEISSDDSARGGRHWTCPSYDRVGLINSSVLYVPMTASQD